MPKASDLLFEGNIKHLHKLSRQTFSLSFISPRKVTLYSFKLFANLSNLYFKSPSPAITSLKFVPAIALNANSRPL